MEIRPETTSDYDGIGAVTEAAFGKAREAQMVAAIRASDRFVSELSLVAVDAGRIVGHVILSYVDLDGARVLELGPMSVLPDRQREGIGSALVRAAVAEADARDEPLVLVLGHSWFYPRFGFRPASEFGIGPPDPRIPDEAFMALPLRTYDPALRGKVVFPDAFAAV